MADKIVHQQAFDGLSRNHSSITLQWRPVIVRWLYKLILNTFFLHIQQHKQTRYKMSFRMQTLNEEEEYSWSQNDSLFRRPGRDIIIAVDHGPKSKHAFDWALLHFCSAGDTLHLVHAVSSLKNNIVYEVSQALMEKLSLQVLKVSSLKVVTRIVEGDAGKAICKEAEKVKPVAVIMGTRGRSLMQSVLQGSVSEYCFHNCKPTPVIIVPGPESGEESVVSLDKK
ncbi:hypothetical protein QVD17_30193 [Tagetes erecta]|uniref:UspA domain-containing protein n=1 Tax=Tagetes erecta TaxID=13708 RepID=A0AAD8K2A5_TARER|nr:hypothetical protein QVD17_30193 [Tagetes erecta]